MKNLLRLALILTALTASRAAAEEKGPPFPETGILFSRLTADPRQVQTGAQYYRLGGRDIGDVALGKTWGLRRWYYGVGGDTAVQVDAEGMAYTQFHTTGGINEFETVDFFANVPVEIRRGPWSGRFTLYHESSHLGDDYIRRTGNTGSRFSVEGVRQVVSYEAGPYVRLYGGGGYLLHRIPVIRRGSLQGGFELTSSDLRSSLPRMRVYLAEDVQSRQYNGWNVDSNTEAGVRLGYSGVRRELRLYVGHYEGHSPFAQFRAQLVSYNTVGVGFDF